MTDKELTDMHNQRVFTILAHAVDLAKTIIAKGEQNTNPKEISLMIPVIFKALDEASR